MYILCLKTLSIDSKGLRRNSSLKNRNANYRCMQFYFNLLKFFICFSLIQNNVNIRMAKLDDYSGSKKIRSRTFYEPVFSERDFW